MCYKLESTSSFFLSFSLKQLSKIPQRWTKTVERKIIRIRLNSGGSFISGHISDIMRELSHWKKVCGCYLYLWWAAVLWCEKYPKKDFFRQKCNSKTNFIQHLFNNAHRRHERRMVHHQKLFRFTGGKDMKLIFPCHYCEIIVFSSLTCSNHCIQITERSQVRGLWTGSHPAVDGVTPVTVFPSSLTCSC